MISMFVCILPNQHGQISLRYHIGLVCTIHMQPGYYEFEVAGGLGWLRVVGGRK